MTKDRMLLHRNLGEGHQKKYILQALKECLDEIERLNTVVEKLIKVHHEWVRHSITDAQDAAFERDLLT